MAPPRLSEDWLAVLLGGLLLAICLGATLSTVGSESGVENPLKPLVQAPKVWTVSPVESIAPVWPGVVGVGVITFALFALGAKLSGTPVVPWARAFAAVFGLATIAYVVSRQATLDHYGLGYMLWAIVIGLVIANTVGAPKWLRPGLRGELYTKVGLVLLGAQVLFGRLLELGLPGVAVAWVVTPVVLVTTFWFGVRVLRIESRSLCMVVSADMSVCGVSAAIATAAATRAKKEELSLAIGLSMLFTVVMMVAMPAAVVALGLGPTIGGAWIGGTIDSTGAVAVAGLALKDETALQVAAAVKMIQNILIGVIAFAVATYWVAYVEQGEPSEGEKRASAVAEIWRRFPKFILGFLGASIVFSLLYEIHPEGQAIVKQTTTGVTKTLRNWCFCLAFTAIGLETDFRRLAGTLQRGKPLVLYVCGQSLNLALTLAMAWLMFGVLFPPTSASPEAALQPVSAERLAESGIEPSAIFYSDHPGAAR